VDSLAVQVARVECALHRRLRSARNWTRNNRMHWSAVGRQEYAPRCVPSTAARDIHRPVGGIHSPPLRRSYPFRPFEKARR
jgi:hypothetical protein